MLKKIFLFSIAVLFLCLNPVYAKKLVDLPEVGSPLDMVVDNGQLFVSDREVKVHVYSLKDFKYQGSISRKGEGPGECKAVPFYNVGPDYIFLYSLGKGIFFSRDGKLKREVKIPSKDLNGSKSSLYVQFIVFIFMLVACGWSLTVIYSTRDRISVS